MYFLLGLLGDVVAGVVAAVLINSAIFLWRVDSVTTDKGKRMKLALMKWGATAIAIGWFVFRYKGLVPSLPDPVFSLVVFFVAWFVMGDKIFREQVLPWLDRKVERLRW